ncbi:MULTISPECIES: BglG family transcription antiterminator [Bacillus]|uniref:Ascorbate-specific PTS system EIIA component n=2 Tax=Bacillus TaxID=1386 RepID=A0A0M5JMN7_9BACI|nr:MULTISPECIES: BglG family transcription antiterminator [Bacillus]ALC83889.1 transcriptional antiterminator BglG [Bacillus gobiensis]MBP1083058.1 transcriptional antiterminator/mannitol/fructose-specific phosphotransferase system IIA component (Ntr-type) [Bacillus capparidis]MED1097976.1 BglG family transcription antiterminator [Bacillus capparidis]
MILDERSANLLRLLQQSSPLKMGELEAQTTLTRRQLQYGIGKVNDWLQSHGYQPIGYDRKVGYYLSDKIRDENLQVNLTKRTYVFSEVDREKVFYLMLLLSREPLSVYHFQYITGASRNTVLKDLQRLKEKVHLLQLQIQYSKQNGYLIKGDSSTKRYVIEQIIHDVLHSTSSNLIIECIWGDQKELIRSIQLQLEQIEKQLGITFTDERLQELTYLFLCTDQLIGKGEGLHSIDSWEELTSTKEYKLVEQMTQTNAFQSVWNQTERLYVTLHLLSMNRTRDVSPLQEDNVIQDLLRKIMEEFEKLACIQLHEKELLYQQLYVHFRPAYYRIQYRISIINTMTERVQRVYPELYHLTKKSLWPVEQAIGFSVPEDEVAYFTVHFGGWLRRQGTTLDDRKRAIVVCPNGVGISNILIYTLRELFPDILFLDALSIRDAANYILSYDLVFSTVHLRTEAVLFVVPPILEMQDKQKLRQQVMQELYGYTTQNLDVAYLLKVISQYATIHEPSQLEKALQSHIYIPTQKINKHSLREAEKPVLEELLTSQTIQLQSRVSDWKEGIRVASQPLVELGTVEERYVEAMIQSIEVNGPYVVITPGVAIPHSRPEQGVRSLSMSLLRLDEAVNFAPDKPVRLIIVLAAADSESHLRALVQLTQMLGEPSNIEDILQSPDKSVLLDYIKRYSEEEAS